MSEKNMIQKFRLKAIDEKKCLIEEINQDEVTIKNHNFVEF